jgi:predicted rRNA methylase
MYIYGKNVIKEAIYNKRKIHSLFVEKQHKDIAFLKFLKDHDVSFSYLDKGKLGQLVDTGLHQGVVADVEPYELIDLSFLEDKVESKLVILDSIEDPHNLGAIIRSAVASGMDGIVMSVKQQVPLNATVAKVSSGAIEHIKIYVVKQLFIGIEMLKEKGYEIIGTDLKANHSHQTYTYKPKTAIVLGNEGKGIRPLIKKECDDFVYIPMKGHIQSLNVSVAAALLMYELTR